MPDAGQYIQIKRLQANLNGRLTDTQKDRVIPSRGRILCWYVWN